MYRSTFLALVVAFLAGASGAPEPQVGPMDPYVAGAVGTLLSYRHYSRVPLDDALATEWLGAYLDALDPGHMIFLQEDIAWFEARASTMDDDLLSVVPRLEVANEGYRLFRTRYDERVVALQARLIKPIDLTNDETFYWDRADAEWPRSAAEADELWRLQLEAELIESILDGATQEEAVEKAKERYERRLSDWLALTPADNLEIYLTALSESFDPHSTYFAPATNDNFDIDISNSVEGIGATLRVEGRYTQVVSLVPGGPADRAGQLKPGDRILSVAQGPEPFEDVVERRLDDVVKLIRGKKGTDVRLLVWPSGAVDPAERVEITITRERVVLEDSHAKGKVVEVPGAGGVVKVGVIDLPSFYVKAPGGGGDGLQVYKSGSSEGMGATADVAALLADFREKGVDAVVLDMSSNGGGSLDEALGISGLFLPGGPVVQVRDGAGRVMPLFDEDPTVQWDGPLVVLTTQVSASASEIVAAALQDYGRAVIVGGATTHGKGTVQTVLDLEPVVAKVFRVRAKEPLGALKVTIQKFYRASGGSTQLEGVVPDVILPSPWDGFDWITEGSLDDPLPWDEIAPARYTPVGDMRPLLPEIRERSAARVAADPMFQRMERARELREEYDRDVIVLDLESRRAEKAQLDEELPSLPEDADANPLLDEALQIAADLVGR
jgi:carboxyl-terminal processing protease